MNGDCMKNGRQSNAVLFSSVTGTLDLRSKARAMARSALLIEVFLMSAGCDTSERISRLEKQNQELQAEVSRNRATADYDLQAKCSKDARVWFNENWTADKGTILLNYTNHYSKKFGKCFILVEFHYNQGKGPSWYNDVMLWNVYENSRGANFVENHFIKFNPGVNSEDRVVTCEVGGNRCKSLEEFNGLVRPYLND